MVGIMPLVISYTCQNLNFANFGVLGQCFIQFALFGDLGLAALMLMSVFVGFVVRYNMPGNLLLPLATALTYTVYIASGGAQLYLFLFLITLILNGVLAAMAMLNFINR